MNHGRSILSAIAMALTVATTAHAGVDHAYTETFDTIIYRDAPATTADWNTSLGELRLNPFSMLVVGSYPSFVVYDTFVYGDRAYVAGYTSGLRVFDIVDAANPTPVVSLAVGSPATTVRVTGDRAIIGTNAGLRLMDVSIAASPVYLGSLATTAPVNALEVSGSVAFVAQSSNLLTVDLSDVTSPAMLDTLTKTGVASDVAVEGSVVYLLTGDALYAIDASDPAALALIGSLPLGGTTAHTLVIRGDIAYIAHSSLGLVVVDISDPSSPQLVTALPLGVEPWGLDVSGDRAYIGDVSGFALHSVDVSDPGAPALVQTISMPGPSLAVTASGELAFVSCVSGGLTVVKIADMLAKPLVSGQIASANQARDVAIHGDVAVVDIGHQGLELYDISDPSHPTFLSDYFPADMDAVEVEVQGHYAYVSDFFGGQLHVVDISGPATPTFVTEVAVSPTAKALTLHGNLAFLGNDFSGPDVFSTVDISDPTAPVVVDTASVVGDPYSFAVIGVDPTILYASTQDEIYVYDVSPGGALTQLGTLGVSFAELAIYGHYLLASGSVFSVYDVSVPTAPVLVDTLQTITNNVVTSGRLAVVRNGISRLQFFDVNDPNDIFRLSGSPDVAMSHRHMTADGNFVYSPSQSYPYTFHTTQIYQSVVSETVGTAQSLVVDASNDTIRKAFLGAAYQDSVLWDLSPDAGAHWEAVAAGEWHAFVNSGVDLKWRSTHTLAPGGINPAVSQLELNWLFDSAVPDTMTDVPGDAGGWARLAFTRSAWDFAGDPVPVTQYDIYRKIADAMTASKVRSDGVPVDDDKLGSVEWRGRTFVTSGSATSPVNASAGTFPPGTWEFVTSIGALQQDSYLATVPTLSDSTAATAPSQMIVVTHTTTPALWFVSEVISGYSVDNIPPGTPTGFEVAYNMGGANVLTWDPAPEPDFQNFNIYRSPDPNFTPTPGDLVYQTTATLWGDTSPPVGSNFYRVTAVDSAGNESAPAVPGTLTAVAGDVPLATKLNGNYPNPFNPSTRIVFSLNTRSDATLDVFDVSGRFVVRLAAGTRERGQHSVTWDGTNASGERVASGVYLCRLRAGGYTGVQRLVLLK